MIVNCEYLIISLRSFKIEPINVNLQFAGKYKEYISGWSNGHMSALKHNSF